MSRQVTLFSAKGGTSGIELWVTDGTAGGTSLFLDIAPGVGDSSPQSFLALGNGKAVFQANDGTSGAELWVTDGTASGTMRLADIAGNTTGSAPTAMTMVSTGKVVFRANDASTGSELWVTDGTATGTSLLRDINPSGSATPSFLETLTGGSASKVIFRANDGTSGYELWATDGTSAGTTLVKNINTVASSGSDPGSPVSLGNGKAIFRASDGTNGFELWVTDGTSAGTSLVKNINTTSAGADSYPTLTALLSTGKALFRANDGTNGVELWATDGTAAGTTLVKDIRAGSASSNPNTPVVAGNGKAVFRANDGVNGTELWVSNGTSAGTTLLKNINATAGASSTPANFFALSNGKVLFQANDGTVGYELWVTDGTAANTSRVKDINPTGDSTPINFAALDGSRALFQANDGTAGIELWVTDGTAAGTSRVADINGGAGSSAPSNIVTFTVATVPTIASVAPDTGIFGDGITNTGSLTVSGTAGASATVDIYEGVAKIATGTASAGGSFSIALGTPLSEGPHSLTVIATEGSLVSSASSVFVATVDTVAPTVTIALVTDSGTRGDNVSSSAELTGTAETGRVVTVLNSAATLGSTTADASGTWSFSPTLADGSYTLTARETDTAGNTGSSTLAFRLDAMSPAVTVALTDDTGPSASDHTTNDRRIEGSGDAGAVTTITEGGVTLGTTVAGPGGHGRSRRYLPTGPIR